MQILSGFLLKNILIVLGIFEWFLMFFNNDECRQNGENINIDIDNYNTNTNSNFNTNSFDMNMADPGTTMMGSVQGPIIEPGRERVIQRNIVHEVKQYIPLLNNNFG